MSSARSADVAITRPPMQLRGVRVHNLKNIDLDIPLERLVVVTGVSGSGKSSLAFETLVAEGERRYLESFSLSARRQLERVEKPDADRVAHVPVAIAVRTDQSRRRQFEARSIMATVAELLDGLKILFTRAGQIHCLACGTPVESQSSADVVAAVESLPPETRCQVGVFAASSLDNDPARHWLARGFVRVIWDGTTHNLSTEPRWPESGDPRIVVDRFVTGKVPTSRVREAADTAFREGSGRCWLLTEATSDAPNATVIDQRHWRQQIFDRQLRCTSCGRTYLPPQPRLFSHYASGACLTCHGTGRVNGDDICPACLGTRFRDEARAVQIAGHSIADLLALTATTAYRFLQKLDGEITGKADEASRQVRADLERRLTVITHLGLGHLHLNRPADTLSGGECRRLMLGAAIGSRLTGSLIVIDEPTSGLTREEIPPVLAALRQLLSLRNSVIAVDHSPHLVAGSDYVVELGPSAGPEGGRIIFEGPPSLWLERQPIADPSAPSQPSGSTKTRARVLTVTAVRYRNFMDRRFKFPLNRLCVISGRSGTGKTTLLSQVVYPGICHALQRPCSVASPASFELSGAESLADVVLVDQTPLTRSPRSNPATWLEVFDDIRQTFAETADAKLRGFTARHFSFNSPQGARCPGCQGTGLLKQDLQFLPDVTSRCPDCGGTRYQRAILDVKYRGRSIADVLSMSVAEAAAFFRSQPRIQSRFLMLQQFGLEYLVLGQPSETLSGGEAQRLKLASRLGTPRQGPCLILCDEPTNGLHPRDVQRLLMGFQELLANGNSLILADNSPELRAAADQVIELN